MWNSNMLAAVLTSAMIRIRLLLAGHFGAILCDYRTENYEDFKELTRKIELFENNLNMS
jgi:hypothetical protein